MKRKHFLYLTAALLAPGKRIMANPMEPEEIFFKDDGIVPKNKYPLLLYRNAFSERDEKGAEWLEQKISFQQLEQLLA